MNIFRNNNLDISELSLHLSLWYSHLSYYLIYIYTSRMQCWKRFSKNFLHQKLYFVTSFRRKDFCVFQVQSFSGRFHLWLSNLQQWTPTQVPWCKGTSFSRKKIYIWLKNIEPRVFASRTIRMQVLYRTSFLIQTTFDIKR